MILRLSVILVPVLATGCWSSLPTPSPALPLAEVSYAAAEAAVKRSDFEEAERLSKTALQQDPLNIAAHLLLANLLAKRGETDLAIVGFQRVLNLNESHPEALFNMGTLLLRRAEPEAAAEILELATAVRPDHTPGLNNLGYAYFVAGLPELAGAAFEETLFLDPENHVALKNLATLAEAAGDSEAANRYRARLRASDGGDQKR